MGIKDKPLFYLNRNTNKIIASSSGNYFSF